MKPLDNISCYECTNHSCFFKQYESSINSPMVETKKQQTNYLIGQYIITEGSPILGIYFVQKGKVKIFSYGLNRTPQIVRLVHSGELLCFRGYGRKTYLTNSVTLEDSRICFFNEKDFIEICDLSVLSMHLVTYLGNELEIAEKRLKYLMQMNVREKTAEALLFMKKSFGINKNNELDVYMSRKDIAHIAGTSEEIIIRQLSDFEKEKLIMRKDHGTRIVFLNEQKLEKLIHKYNDISSVTSS